MRRLYPEFLGGARGLALLVLRLVSGSAMTLHGWAKISGEGGMMHWGDRMGIPGPLQACAALAEFGGGIAWMAGLVMPVASLLLIVTMGVATFKMAAATGTYVGGPGQASFEAASGYLAVAILFLVVGPGRLSADSLLFGRGPVIEPDPARKLAN